MDSVDIKNRAEAAYKLLSGPTTTKEQFEAACALLKGIHPRLDRIIISSSKALQHVTRLQNGKIIDLTAESLPEYTEEDKKRKKYILLFIKYWKELKGEVARVRGEMEKVQGEKEHTHIGEAKGIGRILAWAKGPFGLITLAALVIIFGSMLLTQRKSEPQNPGTKTSNTIKVIQFSGKSIPLSAVYIGNGSDCSAPHYHALDHVSVTATDGTKVADPGGCGFGKVSEVQVIEISQ